jgi:hypothetical protein
MTKNIVIIHEDDYPIEMSIVSRGIFEDDRIVDLSVKAKTPYGEKEISGIIPNHVIDDIIDRLIEEREQGWSDD